MDKLHIAEARTDQPGKSAAGGANVLPAADTVPVATNAWNYTMPARSISVIVPDPTPVPA